MKSTCYLILCILVLASCKKESRDSAPSALQIDFPHIKAASGIGTTPNAEITPVVSGGEPPYTLRFENEFTYDGPIEIKSGDTLKRIYNGSFKFEATDMAGNSVSENLSVYAWDTVDFGMWFPMYPGSRWEYSDGVVDEIDEYVSFGYWIYHGTLGPHVWQYYHTVEYRGRRVFNYSYPYIHSKSQVFEKFILTTEGESTPIEINGDFSCEGLRKTITCMNIDTSLNVNGTFYPEVLHIRLSRNDYYPIQPYICEDTIYSVLEHRFYAKDVGLIRTLNPYTGRTVDLVNYNVNWP